MAEIDKQAVRKAVRWILDQGRCDRQLIEQASLRFDLSPMQQELLLQTLLAERNPPCHVP